MVASGNAESRGADVTCPFCGGPVDQDPRFGYFNHEAGIYSWVSEDGNLYKYHLKPQAADLFALFWNNFGKMRSMNKLIEHLWGNRKDGGPDNPEKTVHLYIRQIREATEIYDSPIRLHNKWGGGYFLERKELLGTRKRTDITKG